jgi:S1-C subfamily serine protease
MLVFVLSTGVNVGVTLKSPCGVTQETFSVLQSITVLVDTGGGRGTGVLVTRRLGKELHTYVWTAGHVVKRGQKPNGTFRDVTVIQELRQGGLLTGTRTVSATVISYSDPERGDDLALLEINVPNWTSVSAVFGATAVLPVGTPLIHVGCTLGLYNSTSLGIVSQTDRFLTGLPKSFEQTSCMGYPGSSGGGVYSYDGRCIGLLVRGAGPGLNMIVPMRRLRAWAAKMGVLWAIDPAVPVPTAVVRLPVKLTDTPPENDAGTVPLTPLSPGGSK